MPRRSRLLLSAALLLAAASGLLDAAPASAATACVQDSGRHLAGRTLTVAKLERSGLACADLRKAHLDGLQLTQLDLHGADLRGATLVKTSLVQADLAGADLAGADLSDATLSQATVTGLELSGARARGAVLDQLDLNGVSLRGADLRGADLDQSTLQHADLRGADLTDASLEQADLTGAHLADARLTGASLTETTGLDTTSGVAIGAFPMDALSALLTLLIALLVLLPRAASRPGRAAAVLVLLLAAAGTVAELLAALQWRPAEDDVFIAPLLTPVVFLMVFVVRALRRPRNGVAAAVLALAGLVGFFLLVGAGLAAVADGILGIVPLQDSCRSAACLGGAARGATGIGAGVVLILLVAVVSRLPALAKPMPSLAGFGLPTGTSRFVGSAPSGAAAAGGPADRGPAPPSQVI